MKKLVSILLVILLLFNFILCNNSYASDPDGEKSTSQEVYTEENAAPSNTASAEILEEGTTSQTQGSSQKVQTTSSSYGTAIIGVITGILARIVNVIIVQLDLLMSQLTYTTENGELKYWFTIERTVFNRVALFNINYFNTYDDGEGTYKVGDLEIEANKSNSAVKKSIANVYYVCRFIAMAIGLLVLIYIGIRMGLSTVASEQARYKKMLIAWVESFVIMFLMLYIISFIIIFGEKLTETFYNLEQKILEATAQTNGGEVTIFEDNVRTQTLNYTFSLSGLTLTFWSIMYWCLLFMEMKFLWTYLKRFLMVGFLIAIAPLITITYSIDKAGDGRAQAFSNWMQEFVMNVLIQPLHALIYMVFVLTANNIASNSPIVAIAFLMSMGAVERMVKVVFNMKDLASLRGLRDVHFFKKG